MAVFVNPFDRGPIYKATIGSREFLATKPSFLKMQHFLPSGKSFPPQKKACEETFKKIAKLLFKVWKVLAKEVI